jgi:hypothetical protein
VDNICVSALSRLLMPSSLNVGFDLSGGNTTLPPSRIPFARSVAASNSPIFRSTSATTSMLRDNADSRRFVMTICYDFAFLEVRNLTKPFIYKGW